MSAKAPGNERGNAVRSTRLQQAESLAVPRGKLHTQTADALATDGPSYIIDVKDTILGTPGNHIARPTADATAGVQTRNARQSTLPTPLSSTRPSLAPHPAEAASDPVASSSRTGAAASPSSSSSSSLSWWDAVVREVRSWRRGTVSIHETESWLQFNAYIRRGFRHRSLRKREALGSVVLYLHNESFNIFSHLLAAIVVLCLLLWPPQLPASYAGAESGSGGFYSGNSQPSDERGVSVGAFVVAQPSQQETRSRGAAAAGVAPPAQVPGWLRTLHGVEAAAAADGADGQGGARQRGHDGAHDEAVRGRGGPQYVPPGGGASPRELLRSHTPGIDTDASSSSLFWSILTTVMMPWRLLSLSFRLFSPTEAADAALADPVSVAARLGFSLGPLCLGLLLTFVLSCTYHTFMPCCTSRRGYQQLLQCDVVGVLLSIGGSAYTYLTCGMPCATDGTRAWVSLLLALSTLSCLYVIVLAPMSGVLKHGLRTVLAVGERVVAQTLAVLLEFVTGAALAAPTGAAAAVGDASAPPLPNRESNTRSEAAASARRGVAGQRSHAKVRAGVGEQPPWYRALLAWIHRHRRSGEPGSDDHHHSIRGSVAYETHAANEKRGGEGEGKRGHRTTTHAEPVHVSARQRALVVGVYCLLHLGIYLWFVYPKSSPAQGGFTQGVYYHNMAYVFLFLGGAVNAARFPERQFFYWTRQAAMHTRQLADVEAALWCAEELAAQSSSFSAAAADLPRSLSWWQRFSFAKFMVTYVVSSSTLDYVGNSHNIWHVCTMLSAFSTVLAVYYDCLEYDLVVCAR